jgi:hypothetical protein
MHRETTVREIGIVPLGEALELTALIAKHERTRLDHLAARWLRRWLDETPAPTLEGAALVISSLGALAARHDWALTVLRELGPH